MARAATRPWYFEAPRSKQAWLIPAAKSHVCWPGAQSVATVDPAGVLTGDVSGLEYEGGATAVPGVMWAVDNGNGGYVNDYQTSASVGAGLLKKQGLPGEVLQVVPSRVMDRDRTYASALALGFWLRTHDVNVTSFNVVTEGAHARRTRLMFEEALGKNFAIGIIAVPNLDYDQRRWWRYSDGVKEVSSEALAYIYSRLLFHPLEPPNAQNSSRWWQAHR